MRAPFLRALHAVFFRREAARRPALSRRLLALLSRLSLVMGALSANSAMAVDGGSVVAGQAAVISTPGTTTINQTSDRAAINWNNFNIGQGEKVQFNQPGADSATLNRVVGAGQTTIDGILNANGRVFIVNPNGVVFGKGASVDVGALTATTLGIGNEAFMQGGNNLQFTSTGNTIPGFVKVEAGAQITAKSFVALLAEAVVSNAGVITAGTDPAAKERGIAMVAGTAASTIHLGGFDVTVDQQSMDALVANSGDLVIGESMRDGSILLNATGRNALMRSLLSSSGKITNNSRGVGSSTTLTSGGGLSHVGDIQAAAGKVDMRAPEIAIDGNVTVGDETTVAPTEVNIGGAGTEHVTQGVRSVITANSQSHGQINVEANKVLKLSGDLIVPTGEIALKSTILDTGLLVAVAGKVSLSGVDALTELPLKTANGLNVYLGKDGYFYVEDGRQLDGAEHLYDEVDGHDVGAVSGAFDNRKPGVNYESDSPHLLSDIPVGLRKFDVVRHYNFAQWKANGLIDGTKTKIEVSLDVVTGVLSIGGATICVVRLRGGLFAVDDLAAADSALDKYVRGLFDVNAMDKGIGAPSIGVDVSDSGGDHHLVSAYISGVNGTVQLRDAVNGGSALKAAVETALVLDHGRKVDLDSDFVSSKRASALILDAKGRVAADKKIEDAKKDPALKSELDKTGAKPKTPAEADKVIEDANKAVADKRIEDAKKDPALKTELDKASDKPKTPAEADTAITKAKDQVAADKKIEGAKKDPALKTELDKAGAKPRTPAEADKAIEDANKAVANKRIEDAKKDPALKTELDKASDKPKTPAEADTAIEAAKTKAIAAHQKGANKQLKAAGIVSPELSALLERGGRDHDVLDSDAFVNSDHVVVDRNGYPMPVPHVKVVGGGVVYVKDDGTFTMDVHGTPFAENTVFLNDKGVQVDQRGRPSTPHKKYLK